MTVTGCSIDSSLLFIFRSLVCYFVSYLSVSEEKICFSICSLLLVSFLLVQIIHRGLFESFGAIFTIQRTLRIPLLVQTCSPTRGGGRLNTTELLDSGWKEDKKQPDAEGPPQKGKYRPLLDTRRRVDVPIVLAEVPLSAVANDPAVWVVEKGVHVALGRGSVAPFLAHVIYDGLLVFLRPEQPDAQRNDAPAQERIQRGQVVDIERIEGPVLPSNVIPRFLTRMKWQ